MSDLRLEQIRGIAAAQRVTRAVIHDVHATLRAGDSELEVVRRMEDRFARAGVRRWLHTPYAWWAERARFSGFQHWEPDALPTHRRLVDGEPFILDAAPLIRGHPADYALAGVFGAGPAGAVHAAMLERLRALKAQIATWAATVATGAELYAKVAAELAADGSENVHALYPASVLGHALHALPPWLGLLPTWGRGFQPAIVLGYALLFGRHRLAGAPSPFINPLSSDRPLGIYAVEPHLGRGVVGAKFESILLVDGDETRWLDPELFGDVVG
jgi:hypothetical protein